MSPGWSSRAHATRAEVLSTLAVVALVVLGIVALWPRSAGARHPGTDDGRPGRHRHRPRPAARRRRPRSCPAPNGAPATGPLAGVTVPCLGAPGTVDLGAALAGRPALLNVWASWCAPCRAELPALAEYAARADAVPVVGVDVQDDPRSALALLRELGVTLPSVTDPDGALRGSRCRRRCRSARSCGRRQRRLVDPPTPFTSADEVAAAVERLRAGDR